MIFFLNLHNIHVQLNHYKRFIQQWWWQCRTRTIAYHNKNGQWTMDNRQWTICTSTFHLLCQWITSAFSAIIALFVVAIISTYFISVNYVFLSEILCINYLITIDVHFQIFFAIHFVAQCNELIIRLYFFFFSLFLGLLKVPIS